MSLEKRIENVKNNIYSAARRAGRKPEEITLVAISKRQSVEKIRGAYQFGLRDFGENYVQEARAKQTELEGFAGDIQYHFVGHLQGNKVKQMVDHFCWIHSVDRLSIVEELAKRSTQNLKFLLQVNLAEEKSKMGVLLGELEPLIEGIQKMNLEKLQLHGLMIMPPLVEAPEKNRTYFDQLRELASELKGQVSAPHSLEHLSMGTSHDYEIAVEEGATMVRLGTVLFGSREDS